ncbi:MAG TPA: ribonuclease E/G, partial [Rhodothermales bacterium]
SRVELPSGGYLFIEKTEAMYVIDVNSGRSGRGMTQEANSLKVNLEAARVLARQVRLRDIGGIIVVDFIDLREDRNRAKVFDELKKEFRKDRAVVKMLPMSDFGLVQITRQRLRPSITVTFAGPNGAAPAITSATRNANERGRERTERSPRGESAAPEAPAQEAEPRAREERAPMRQAAAPERRGSDPEALVAAMERWLTDYRTSGKRNPVILRVHPFTAAFLMRKTPAYPTRWFVKLLIRIRVEVDPKLDPLSFRFRDARSGDDITDRIELPKGPKKQRQGVEA